ncbi:MAG: cell shape determination protein CcmA [Gallionellales bacterium RIFCSPLOWO2_12_FULL_59_22]|nr:MAG: cell shape determination protein CcmA [Gallionellales bacterium RIFCSPLOWO2_02_FULL_59_110]OGT11654.1 MAG: cell shape determination protein CcmA [Gallionellales bacterium RIFCSPLOWO2_12_FULL_59_22]
MFGKKHSKPQSRIDSLIGAGTTIEGNLTFSGGMRIDGQVNGNVVAAQDKPSTLVLSEHARVVGEINVTHLVINGSTTGPVSASEYLELQGKARVNGDVHYKTLEIQLGAIVEGRLIHNNVAAQEKVVAFKLNSGE